MANDSHADVNQQPPVDVKIEDLELGRSNKQPTMDIVQMISKGQSKQTEVLNKISAVLESRFGRFEHNLNMTMTETSTYRET